MLRGNLSSRPFYNERMVSLVIGLVALAAIALAGYNGYKVYALSKQRGELRSRIAQDTTQAQEIERQAVTLERNINRTTLAALAVSTQEANALIDQRTFSWTVFFGLIEKTLPFDLHLTEVRPRIQRGEIQITIRVLAKRIDDIDTFINALQDTGAFYDLIAANMDRNEEGNTFNADITAYYLAPNRALPAPGKKSAGGPARRTP
jgi:hypothetical protein